MIGDVFKETFKVLLSPKFAFGIMFGYILYSIKLEFLMPIFATVFLIYLALTIAIMYFKEMDRVI